MPPDPPLPEETLDPPDWNDLKRLGHRMVDEMMDYLASVRERPVWRPVPPEVRLRLRAPLPARISRRTCSRIPPATFTRASGAG